MYSSLSTFLTALKTYDRHQSCCAIIIKCELTDLESSLPGLLRINCEEAEAEYRHESIVQVLDNPQLAARWIVVEHASLLDHAQQAIIRTCLARLEHPYRILFLVPKKMSLTILERECLVWHLEDNVQATPPEHSLRQLLVGSFKELPSKDDKKLLSQLDQLTESLVLEADELFDATLKKQLLMTLSSLMNALHSPIQGQLLARLIKWSCYRYLKAKKAHAASTK